MVELTVELPAKEKLRGTNFLDWKVRMKSILQLKRLYLLVTQDELATTSLKLDKKDPYRCSNAMAILTLNCDVKIVLQFADEADDGPCKFWELLENNYQPKTIQNQSTFLNHIFTTVLTSDKLEANLTTLYENLRILCSLIDDKKTKPPTLLDSLIATWAIINLPDNFKMAGELIIKKCEIEKATPSLKQTIEELRLYIQQNKSSQEAATSRALAASRQPFPNPDGPKCLNGEHNPLTRHKDINSGELIFNSGASSPMFNSPQFFTELQEHNTQVFQADGSSLQVTGIGTVRLDLPFMVLHLQNVLLVPKLSSNLISQSTFLRSGHIIRASRVDGFAVVDDQNRTVLDGSYALGNLIIRKSSPSARVAIQPLVSAQTLALHQAAGHPSLDYLKKMFPQNKIEDFNCVKFVDQYSHYIWIHFLTSKTKTNKLIKTLFNQIENASGERIAYLFSNNGTELKNKDLCAFYYKKGIKHLPTAPYTPENNSFAEQGNRTTVNKARCLLKHSGLSQRYWAEACNTAVYLENRTVFKSISFLTLYKMWFQKPPKLNRLFPFGCQAVFLKNRASGKFGDQGAAGTFLGYGEGHWTYRIDHGETGIVQTTHHVKFHKHTFPAKILHNPAISDSDTQLFTIFIDAEQPKDAAPDPAKTLDTPPGDPNLTIYSSITSKQSTKTKDLDFFHSNSLIPSNDQEGDPNTIDQQIVEVTPNNGPIHEIIGDVCDRNIVEGRL
ncbi:hypothetical protein PCANC_22964 [Puccinia coronata f. sp. avenae]|uniref:Integrase catalytic domain-containing protein n=1 Tax=Puccinia coronata f. sp. avenae TaxID=200324 RepID=A0A2N5SQE8_9BASI|nr:hypothetical protein PCANC_22964 [Puccinia coronata f. sp. avenae]